MNNVFWATGTGPGMTALVNKPTMGLSNNVEGTMATTHFTAPEGMNPDFTLSSTATTLKGMGGTNPAAPTKDLGFDPKCLVKRPPPVIGSMAQGSWWEYSIDYDYIKSIGGVASCFNGGMRTTNDIGAYKDGAVATKPVAECKPTIPADHAGPPGAAGSAATGGVAAPAARRLLSGWRRGDNRRRGPGAAGAVGAGGTRAMATARRRQLVRAAGAPNDGGCGCRVGREPRGSSSLVGLAAIGWA